MFANFADQFTAEGDTRLSAANKNKKPLARGFAITDAMMADFRTSLETQKVRIDEAALKQDDAFIRAMIHYEIDLALFGIDEARRNLILKDPQAQFAANQFAEAVRLTELVQRRRAQRARRDA